MHARGENWVTSWASCALGAGPVPRPHAEGFEDQTIRVVLRDTSAGGSAVRLRLSNAFGSRMIRFERVTLGRHAEGAGLVPGSCVEVTFSGASGVLIPRGAVALSDPVAFDMPELGTLVLNLYAQDATGPTTAVTQGATAFLADGDRAGETDGDEFAEVGPLGYFVTAVEVLAPPDVRGTIVGFGDSITAMGWPGLLARRMFCADGRRFGVANAGIGGNRVLRDGLGESALARMDRDVLGHPGLKAVLFMEGVNDLGFPHIGNMEGAGSFIRPDVFDLDAPSADELIAAHRQVIHRAHARGVQVFGSVLTPFKGAAYWSEEGEAARQALNDWIRNSGEYDAVLDFAAAVADPADPERLASAFDTGDHLHPNPDGQRAIAESIDLALLDAL